MEEGDGKVFIRPCYVSLAYRTSRHESHGEEETEEVRKFSVKQRVLETCIREV